jgi:integrase
MRTAKSWGYACGEFDFADLTLPREGVKKEQRAFTDDEVRRMIQAAPEPFSTILAITAVLGLRIGETLGLRVCDVDFAKRIIRVRQSVDSASRTSGGTKSKASSADMRMSTELETRLRSHLSRLDGKSELLFRQPEWTAVLCRQAMREETASAVGCVENSAWRVSWNAARCGVRSACGWRIPGSGAKAVAPQ